MNHRTETTTPNRFTISQAFGRNVLRARTDLGLSRPELCARVQALGYPLHPAVLLILERGYHSSGHPRRGTVDELVALSGALKVAPMALLVDRGESGETRY